jgi:HD-GYP domain-containing protein (c-di-GMP phosphodiesterase class II)
MQGWEEAAKIVLHHNEHVDGQGFPYGLTHEGIHPGARIFAIADVSYSLTLGRTDRTQGRTIIRAISAINARIDIHFDGIWVQCFNHMIRKEIKERCL